MPPPFKLRPEQVSRLVALYRDDGYTATDLADDFGIDVKSVCRYLELAGIPRDPSRRGRANERRKSTACRVCGGTEGLRMGRCDECTKEANRIYNITRTMGISVEQYEDAFRRQGGVCAICEQPGKRLAMDHDHACCPGRKACGKCFRGLLCIRCNRAIGVLGEGNLERALVYLSRR